MYAIIVSQQDPAGMNIKQRLLEQFGFKETEDVFQGVGVYEYGDARLYTITERPIFAENLDKEIDADVFIFATTHRAASGVASLSVHPIGNWSTADLGGKPNALCIAAPLLMRKAFLKLKELNTHDYEVTMEATHHGPYLEKPVLFIEIGSDLKNWENPEAGTIIAKTIVHLLEGQENVPRVPVAFAIGGTHYCANFNKRIDTVAIAHVCPKHALEYLDKEMMQQAIAKSMDRIDFVVLDWKGLGAEKQRVISLFDELGIEWKRSDRI